MFLLSFCITVHGAVIKFLVKQAFSDKHRRTQILYTQPGGGDNWGLGFLSSCYSIQSILLKQALIRCRSNIHISLCVYVLYTCVFGVDWYWWLSVVGGGGSNGDGGQR